MPVIGCKQDDRFAQRVHVAGGTTGTYFSVEVHQVVSNSLGNFAFKHSIEVAGLERLLNSLDALGPVGRCILFHSLAAALHHI